MDEPTIDSRAVIMAVESGFRLTVEYDFVGERTDEDGRATVEQYRETWEQTRLILQTLSLVGFTLEPGQVLMERRGSAPWRQPTPPATAPPPPEAPPIVSTVQAILGNGAAPEPVQADPVLHAAVHGKAPFLTKALAAEITRNSPPEQRPVLAKMLGQSAEQIYLWLSERSEQAFTVGEVARGTTHSDYVTAARLKDLEGAGLVLRGVKAGQGKHKSWVTFRAVAENREETHKEKRRKVKQLAQTGSA